MSLSYIWQYIPIYYLYIVSEIWIHYKVKYLLVAYRHNFKSHPDMFTLSVRFLYSNSESFQQETLNSRRFGKDKNRLAVTMVKGTGVPWRSKIFRFFKLFLVMTLSKKWSLRKLEKLPSSFKHSNWGQSEMIVYTYTICTFFLDELRKFTMSDLPKQAHLGYTLITLFFSYTL